jgi:hypothetical protein
LCRAENEKMISVEYSGVYKDIILKRLHTVCTDESTSLESEVNAVRLAVMDEATERYCIPEAINAMRDDALRASREHLIELCGDKLWNRASEDLSWMREIKLNERVTNLLKRMQTEQMEQRKLDRRNAASASMYDSDDEYSNMRGGDEEYEMEGEGSGVQIGARYRRDGCLFLPPRGVKGMGKPIFVILNEAGELIDHMMLNNLRQRDETSDLIKTFMKLHTPRRVVMNTSGGKDAFFLKKTIDTIAENMNDSLAETTDFSTDFSDMHNVQAKKNTLQM